MKRGYARVSTTEQDTSLQLAALRGYGCDVIYEDKISAVKHRPQLERLLAEIGAGDELVIYKLDRVARSMKHLLQIIEHLESRKARLRSLTEPINDETPAGRLMIQMLGAFAEFERGLIRERVIAGQVEAVKRGVKFGKGFRLSKEAREEVARLVLDGMPIRVVADAYGVGREMVRRIRLEALGLPVRGAEKRMPVLSQYLPSKHESG